MSARHVQPCFAAEAKNVLQGHYGQIRRRALGEADESPVRAIFTRACQSLDSATLFFFESRPPSEGRVVVVCTGVDDTVGAQAMRKRGMRARVAKCEL